MNDIQVSREVAYRLGIWPTDTMDYIARLLDKIESGHNGHGGRESREAEVAVEQLVELLDELETGGEIDGEELVLPDGRTLTWDASPVTITRYTLEVAGTDRLAAEYTTDSEYDG